MDSDEHIDIRERIRAYGARQLVLARLSAPEDWQGELRGALAAQSVPRSGRVTAIFACSRKASRSSSPRR
jgi:hypothetical protein